MAFAFSSQSAMAASSDSSCELLKPANVIHVVVRRHQIVDPGRARIRQRRHDAIGVSPAGMAAVDQHGLSARRHVERRLAALRVDHVDVERPGRGALRGERPRAQDD